MKHMFGTWPLVALLAALAAGTTGLTKEMPAKDDVEALVRGSNQFSLELLRAQDEKGNLFLSPFSVGTALSLAFANNEGDEVAKLLHVPFKQKKPALPR